MYLPEWAQKFKEPKTEIRIIGGHCYNGCSYVECGIKSGNSVNHAVSQAVA
jgi:hypothetical protein